MRRILAYIVTAFLGACSTELPHEAAYDPGSPLEKQARSVLTAEVQLEGESDFSQVTVELQNDARTYSVDTDAQGAAKLTGVVPGTYRLSVRTRYFEPVTQSLSIGLGETHALGALRLRALRSDVVGSALIERLEQESKIVAGGASLTLRRTGSIRSANAPGAPAYRPAAASAVAEFQTASAADGAYRFSEVPVGTYELIVSAGGIPSVTIPNVQVPGAGDVNVADVLLQPVTGFFNIVGTKAGGAADSQYTATPAVTLEITGINAPKMQIGSSADGTVAGCQLQAERAYDTPLAWTLGEPEGLKTVCVRFIGEDGTTSPTRIKSILYDKTAPSPVVVTPLYNNGYLKTDYVLLNIAAVDSGSGIGTIRLGTGPDLATAATLPFQPTLQVPLGLDDEYLRYLWVLDAAGNASAMYTLAVTVDTQGPTAPSLTVVQQPSTRFAGVNLTLSAVNATEFTVADDPAFSGRAWQPYTTATNWILPPGDGTKTVYVKFRDAAGNGSDLASDATVLDTTPPVASSFVVNGGAAVTSSTVLAYAVTVTEAFSFPLQLQVASDPGFSGAVWKPYATAGTFTMAPGDGYRTVYARFQDAVGNLSPPSSASFLLDQLAPQISYLLVNDNNDHARATIPIVLQIGNWTAGDVLQVAESADFALGTQFAVNAGSNTLTYTLSNGDGAKNLYIRARDSLGNSGTVFPFAVTRDTIPPWVLGPKAVAVEGDREFATHRFANVDLNITGASQMLLSENASFAGASWEPFAVSTLWVLSSVDGPKTLFAMFRDEAGNVVGAYQDQITLDTVVPASPLLSISAGAAYATQVTVALSLSATGANWMQISNDGIFDIEPVQPYATSITDWALTVGDGIKAVYVRYVDDAGNNSEVVSDFTVLDTVAPSSVSLQIDGGAAFTRNAGGSVTLTLSAVDAYEMYLSEGTCGLGSSWVGYTSSKAFMLTPSQGSHSVFARFSDQAGNLSPCVSDDIILDSVLFAPALAAAVVGGPIPGRTRSQIVAVQIAGLTTDVTQMMLSNDSGFSSSNWVSATTTTSWVLTPGDGMKFVWSKVRDAAGNESALLSPAIELDQTGPQVPGLALVDLNGDGYALSETTVELAWTTPSDPYRSGFIVERYVAGKDLTYGLLSTFPASTTSFVDDITTSVGFPHHYRIAAYDDLGNTSAWSVSIVANPFEPILQAYFTRTVAGYRYDFPPSRGTFSMRPHYSYDLVNYQSFVSALPTDVPYWQRPNPTEFRFNEALVIRTGNQDGGLVFESTLPLRNNERIDVDSAGDKGRFTSIAHDAAGNAHISYVSWDMPTRLLYATNKNGAWDTETVFTSAGGTLRDSSIAVTSGAVHLVVFDESANNLRYFSKANGTWSSGVVMTDGRHAALTADANGKLHVIAAGGGGVRYANNITGTWSGEAADAGVSPPQCSTYSIEIDSAGDVHIAYVTTFDVRYARKGTGGWTVTPLSGGFFDWECYPTSIALDKNDNPHVSFTDGMSVSYATAVSAWAVETVSTYGLYNSIVVDSTGYGHIAYWDTATFGLRYATNRTGAWISSDLDPSSFVGRPVSLTIDGWDRIQASYFDEQGMNLKYAAIALEPQVREDADAAETSYESSLAIDSKGNAHLLYYVPILGKGLMYATNVSGGWVRTTLDSAEGIGNSIKLDANDKAHISYATNVALRYGTNKSGTWVYDVIESTGMGCCSGNHTKLALDASGKAHLAYRFGLYPSDLRYATNRSGGWQISQVDTVGDVGQTQSIALDLQGKAHISYYDATNRDLKYATNMAGPWAASAVDTAGDVGEYSALAVDSNGKVFIAYYDASLTDLKVASGIPGSWNMQTVDASGNAGYAPSIGIDKLGNAHVAYRDGASQNLMYATNAPGRWISVELDDTGKSASTTSLAFDPLGRVHLSLGEFYFSRFQGWLPVSSVERVSGW